MEKRCHTCFNFERFCTCERDLIERWAEGVENPWTAMRRHPSLRGIEQLVKDGEVEEWHARPVSGMQNHTRINGMSRISWKMIEDAYRRWAIEVERRWLYGEDQP